MILFIDFDGVLHPVQCDPSQQFIHVARLEVVLRQHDGLMLALSTSWQDAHSIDSLRRHFSGDIAKRIVGGTFSADPDRKAKSRHQQIQMFLRASRRPQDQWTALDDTADGFPPRCTQLVLCDPARGFDEQAETRLRTRLLGRV